MHPVLVTVGGWQVQSYGVFVAVAFVLAIGLAMREARLAGEDPQRVLDLAFYVVIAALVGAKLVWLIGNEAAYRDAPDRWRILWEGGLSFWGGFLAALAVAAAYLFRHRLSVARVADLAAPAVAAGLAVAELGCLAAGCDYGQPTAAPIGIVFTDARSLAPTGVRVHPTQVYAAAWALLVFLLLLLARRLHRRPGVQRPGQLALLAVAGLAIGDFAIGFFRGAPRPMLVEGVLSVAQPIELAIGLVALGLFWRRSGGAQPKPTGAPRSTGRRRRGAGRT